MYEIEKAAYIAENGRKGPVWVDVPMDIQSREIDPAELRHFEQPTESRAWDKAAFLAELKAAKRPVILCGSALRSTGYTDKFRELAKKIGIPVMAATYNADLFANGDEAYFGNFGIIGGRAGNFLMQNADLVIGMGCRMTFRQIGFNYENFSPDSRRVVMK